MLPIKQDTSPQPARAPISKGEIMNRFVIPQAGQYGVWASDPGRREIRVLIDGVPDPARTAESNLGPTFGDATLELELDLAEGAVITTSPEDAPLIVGRAGAGAAAGTRRRGLPARPVRGLRTPPVLPLRSHGSAPVPCQREADPGARGDGARRFPGHAEDFPG